MNRYLRIPLVAFGTISLLFFFLWAVAALYIDAGPWWCLPLILVTVVSGFYFSSAGRTSLFVLVCCVAVLAWWLTLSPENDRQWRPEVAGLPTATFDGSQVTIANVRNFDYQSENVFVENWETRSLDLDKLVGADLSLSFWGPTQIAHTITSWRFSDGQHIAVSIEVRKESHEEYSAYKGFFRQFEVYYVFADERDLIGLRTNYRGEQVNLYRLNIALEDARALLLSYLREINQLSQEARWYNAFTHNCTTAIRYHGRQIGAAGELDWRLFANGHLAELLYERGMLDQSLPLQDLLAISNITDKAKQLPGDANFSQAIRAGLPGFSQ